MEVNGGAHPRVIELRIVFLKFIGRKLIKKWQAQRIGRIKKRTVNAVTRTFLNRPLGFQFKISC